MRTDMLWGMILAEPWTAQEPVLFWAFCNNAGIFHLAMNFIPISAYWVRDEARKRYGECYAKKKKKKLFPLSKLMEAYQIF